MLTRATLLGLGVCVASSASAASIVTWQSLGEVTLSQFVGMPGTDRTPPVGTPYQLTMTFDSDSMTRTLGSPSGSNCFTLTVDGSLALGAASYSLAGWGFTHAQLPGTTCTPSWPETQFLLGVDDAAVNPWVLGLGFMELSYRDLIAQDGFPATPTSTGMFLQMRDSASSFLVQGRGDLQAIPQVTAVPEPGTALLFGLGLAAAARAIHRRRIDQ